MLRFEKSALLSVAFVLFITAAVITSIDCDSDITKKASLDSKVQQDLVAPRIRRDAADVNTPKAKTGESNSTNATSSVVAKSGNSTVNKSGSIQQNVSTPTNTSSSVQQPEKAKDSINGSEKSSTASSIKPSESSIMESSSVSPVPKTTSNLSASTTASPDPVLPDRSAAEEEHNSSMSIFFVLGILALGILLIHLMLQFNFQYIPESVVIVFLGALIGLILNLMSDQNITNWRKEEAFSPTAFFLVLLPPIIFESGYNLHKGNFFQVSLANPQNT